MGRGSTQPCPSRGQAYSALRLDFDREDGGFGTAPKFPHPIALEFLLRYFHPSQNMGALEIVDLTLEKMTRGGIYDQLGGGFHHYATDSHWLVPHFEKLLYDNALLSRIYLHAYLVTGNRLYRSITEETLDYVLREMADPQGGFYSTQDADSEGIEGKYYLWTAQEITKVLGEKTGQIVNSYLGIIEQAKTSLLERREQRVKPSRDERIPASWNGLTLDSLAEAACALDRQDYLTAAVANGSFLLDSMIAHGCLQHTYKDGQAKIDSYLRDYALVCCLQ